MGVKEIIHRLGSPQDFSILVTEELHQVFAVQGYKRKTLSALLNAFGCLSYSIEIQFPIIHDPQWKLEKAGLLKTHIQLQDTIHIRLLPTNGIANLSSSIQPLISENAVKNGKCIMRGKAQKLQEQYPDDANAIFEYFGRLNTYYKSSATWEWYLCPRSGTSLNLHIQPVGVLDPLFFLRAQQECKIARINTIHIYPYTVEIVFHAFTQVEQLPYNRRHRARFQPY